MRSKHDLELLRRRFDRRLLVGRLDVAQKLRRRALEERDVPAHGRFGSGKTFAYWLLRQPVRVPGAGGISPRAVKAMSGQS